jgi:hypothetical protein
MPRSFAWLLLAATSHGFTVLTPRRAHRPSFSSLGLSTLAPPVPVIKGNSTDATAWECDEDANCVVVPACDEEKCRTSLDVRIHGEWYDLSGTSR